MPTAEKPVNLARAGVIFTCDSRFLTLTLAAISQRGGAQKFIPARSVWKRLRKPGYGTTYSGSAVVGASLRVSYSRRRL